MNNIGESYFYIDIPEPENTTYLELLLRKKEYLK